MSNLLSKDRKIMPGTNVLAYFTISKVPTHRGVILGSAAAVATQRSYFLGTNALAYFTTIKVLTH
jgi:hypothetical protein